MNSYSRVLIQELADYEKMPDGPKISEETLEEDGFGNETFFRCFVAELNKKVYFCLLGGGRCIFITTQIISIKCELS